MATPTEAEIQDQIRRAIKIFEELRQYGEENADNLVGMQDAFVQNLEGDYSPAAAAAMEGFRTRVAAALAADPPSVLAPLLLTYAKFLDVPERDAQGIFDRLFDHFVDNALTVQSRVFVFGAPTPDGGNTGDGEIVRLNTDKEGFDIENQFADAKVAECVQDQSTGTVRHEEVFEIRTGDAGRDAVQVQGSGILAALSAQSARQSLLANPSFSNFGGTIAVPTSITNWTVGAIGNFEIDEVNFYRGFLGDTTPRSLKIKATENVSQKIENVGLALNPNVPYLLQVAWNRSVGGATGTLEIRMGTKVVSVVVAAQVGWQRLRVVPDFPVNFNEEALDIEIDWTRTAGDLLVDDVLFIPGTNIDNSWYWLIGGQTPFLLDDKFTWTDTETGAILQRWFWRSFGRYLPHAPAAPTWAEPTP